MLGGPHYQDIRRSVIRPPLAVSEPEQRMEILERSYRELAEEVVRCHNRVFSLQVTVAALAANVVVTLPAPYPDTNYSPVVILGWAAFGYLTAITTTTFTVTFSVAAPAVTGGIMRCIIIR